MPKTAKIEYDKRIMVIQSWILDNHPSQLIDQQILLKAWCTSDRQARRMRKDAWETMSKYEEESIEDRRRKKILELEQRKRTLLHQFKGTPAGIRALNAVDKEIMKLDPALLGGSKKDTEQPPVTAIAISGSDISFEQAYLLKYGKKYDAGAA